MNIFSQMFYFRDIYIRYFLLTLMYMQKKSQNFEKRGQEENYKKVIILIVAINLRRNTSPKVVTDGKRGDDTRIMFDLCMT